MIYQRGMLVFVVLVAAERPRCATCSLRPSILHCCRPTNGDEFEGKAAESLKNETLRYLLPSNERGRI
jgi:hypothetical protein